MPRYSFPNEAVAKNYPSKPFAPTFSQVNPAAATYYTALDISGGGGLLSKLTYGLYVIFADILLRITIDGNTFVFPSNSGSIRYTALGGDSASYAIWVGIIGFKQSLKVEIQYIPGSSNRTLTLAVDYSLF